MQFLDSHGSRRITRRLYGKLGKSNCQKPTLKPLSSILLKMDKGGKRSKKKKMNFERNYCNKVHRKETEQNMNRPCLKERRDDNRTTKPDPEPLLSRRNEDQGNFQRRITLRNRTTRFNEIEDETETEPTSPDWRQRRQNKGKFPMMGNPSTKRIEQITKQSDGSNWRSRRWEKPILEDESPSLASKTEMSIKLENNDEQDQRSRLKEIIMQRIKSQSIARPTKKSIEEIAQDDENERNQRSRLKEIIKQRIESQSITQTPFIEEMESDEEDQKTETEEDTIDTPEEQKKRLIQAYLTSTMEKEETAEEQNERRKLIHAYSKCTMDNNDEQIEQDETEMYLRTSTEEEQKPSTWEEYNEEEPFEKYDKDESFKENDNEGKWPT